jgi:hypothetical protein
MRKEIEGSHDAYLKKLDDKVKEVEKTIERIQLIQRGERGFPGYNGKDGKDGKDGYTPTVDHNTIARHVLKLLPAPKDGLNGRPGKDGKAPTIKEVFDHLKENLKVEHIPGLKNEIDSYRNQLAGKVYGRDTLVRGGGDTVAAGTGIAISKDVNGKTVITNTASGAGTAVYNEVVSGSGTSFTLAHTPVAGTLRL